MVKMTLKWPLQTKIADLHCLFEHELLRLFFRLLLTMDTPTKCHVAKCNVLYGDWIFKQKKSKSRRFKQNVPKMATSTKRVDFSYFFSSMASWGFLRGRGGGGYSWWTCPPNFILVKHAIHGGWIFNKNANAHLLKWSSNSHFKPHKKLTFSVFSSICFWDFFVGLLMAERSTKFLKVTIYTDWIFKISPPKMLILR